MMTMTTTEYRGFFTIRSVAQNRWYCPTLVDSVDQQSLYTANHTGMRTATQAQRP